MRDKIVSWLCRVILRKPIVVGKTTIYELWKPEKDAKYFYPSDINYGKIGVGSTTFSSYTSDFYKEGNFPGAFAQKEHALEAARRIQKVLKEFHDELGY